jgi:hypothetical protein
MPSRRQRADYYTLLEQDREQQLTAMAHALAAEQGMAPGTKHANQTEEDYLYHWTDPLVTPDHLAQIAQQTTQEWSQKTDDQGQPLWTPQQIAMEVAAQQQRALTPKRFDLIETGRPDPEEQWAFAQRLAKRHGDAGSCPTCAPAPMAMGGNDGMDQPAMQGAMTPWQQAPVSTPTPATSVQGPGSMAVDPATSTASASVNGGQA